MQLAHEGLELGHGSPPHDNRAIPGEKGMKRAPKPLVYQTLAAGLVPAFIASSLQGVEKKKRGTVVSFNAAFTCLF